MQVPVVPVAIEGTAEVVPPGRMGPTRRGVVTVRFGAPLRFFPTASHAQAKLTVEDAIRSLLAVGVTGS
jgi:hypothetical protein